LISSGLKELLQALVLKRVELLERFSQKDGYVAVTYESWFTDERPAEIENWWIDNVPEINTIAHNISVMQKRVMFQLPRLYYQKNAGRIIISFREKQRGKRF